MNKNVLKLTYGGVMAALTFISTSFMAFPIAVNNGYIHLGDGFVLSCGVVLGKKYGALAAGIGSALADIYLGYASWALPTFVIKALMAYLVGYVFEELADRKKVSKVSGIFSAVWVTFMAFLAFLVSGEQRVLASSDSLLGEGVINATNELTSTAGFTGAVILVSMVALPLIIALLLMIAKPQRSFATKLVQLTTFVSTGAIMIVLYYLTAAIMYGNWTVPAFAVPKDMVQYVLGIAIATMLLPLTMRFQKTLNA